MRIEARLELSPAEVRGELEAALEAHCKREPRRGSRAWVDWEERRLGLEGALGDGQRVAAPA
ncbi:MAG: hypothetical protein N2047_06205 [Meiothermus sp.]|jgi:hypothetical protein|uniref:hypothetical protein n=1 Tax=Meiothermus cerbereus TaxID=65552 RepID=UPI003EF00F6B|nr:hypothetical protein [Meiothermus sp.]